MEANPQARIFALTKEYDDLEVVGFMYTDDDCDLIIGMDIMTQGDLSLTNMEGRTVFSFRIPSLHVVDFEAELSM